MASPVLVFLALLWAAVLIPVGLRVVAERRAYYASSFGDGLQALEQAQGPDPVGSVGLYEPARADPDAPARSTRVLSTGLLREILAGLLVAVAVSAVAAVLIGERAALAVNLALDDCLLLFVATLVIRRDARAARRDIPEPGQTTAGYAPADVSPPVARRVYTAGAPVISAPVVGALSSSVARTA